MLTVRKSIGTPGSSLSKGSEKNVFRGQLCWAFEWLGMNGKYFLPGDDHGLRIEIHMDPYSIFSWHIMNTSRIFSEYSWILNESSWIIMNHNDASNGSILRHLLRSSGQKHHVGAIGRSDRNICTEFDDGLQDITSLFRLCSCHQEGLIFVVAQFLATFLTAKEKIACDQMLRVCGPVNEWVFKKLKWLFLWLECCLQCKTSNTAREESNLGTGTDKPEIGLLISARQLASVRIISVSPENLEVLKFRRWGKEQVNNASIILLYIILHIYHNYCRYQLCYSCLQIVLVSMLKDIQFSLRGGPSSGFCTDKHWWWYDGVWWVVWWLWWKIFSECFCTIIWTPT